MEIGMMFFNVFSSVISWFSTLMEKTNMRDTWLQGVLIVIVVRLLLQPFLGVAIHMGASDRVQTHNRWREQKGNFQDAKRRM